MAKSSTLSSNRRDKKQSRTRQCRYESKCDRKRKRRKDYYSETSSSSPLPSLSSSLSKCDSSDMDSDMLSESSSDLRPKRSTKHKPTKRRKKEKTESSWKQNKRKKSSNEMKKSKKKRQKQKEFPSSLSTQSKTILNALVEILNPYPDMSSQILTMLRQMGTGTSFDLGQMTNAKVAQRLEHLFYSLKPYGVENQCRNHTSTSVWLWNINNLSTSSAMEGVTKKWDEYLLLKIMKTLLDQAGITMDAIQKRELQQSKKSSSIKGMVSVCANKAESVSTSLLSGSCHQQNLSLSASKNTELSEFYKFTTTLLSKFSIPSNNRGEQTFSKYCKSDNEIETPSLAHQLSELCQYLLDGETLSLETIPNVELQTGLQILFSRAGLHYHEMEIDNESDTNDDDNTNDIPKERETLAYGCDKNDLNKQISKSEQPLRNVRNNNEQCMGFGLPDPNTDLEVVQNVLDLDAIKDNIKSIIQSCQDFTQSKTTEQLSDKCLDIKEKILKGPSLQSTTEFNPHDYRNQSNQHESDSSDDYDGPAPAGSIAAKRRNQIGAYQYANQMKQTVKTSNNTPKGGREEWMMKPGEHNFLESIMRTGNLMKNRKFKNETSNGGNPDNPDNPDNHVISARLQKQMDDIIQEHAKARGPSLIYQHRERKAEEKLKAANEKGDKNKWKWSRDDLDAGRRVDKKALGQILGGAAKELTDKFQGGRHY